MRFVSGLILVGWTGTWRNDCWTDERLTVMNTLAALTIPKMQALAEYFHLKTGKTLLKVVESETSGWFG